MECKFVEIRDAGTFIPAMAITIEPSEHYLVKRAGFITVPGLFLVKLTDGDGNNDAFAWPNRTMQAVHHWLEAHWMEHKSGDVVDVQFILGEKEAPKLSEQLTEDYR